MGSQQEAIPSSLWISESRFRLNNTVPTVITPMINAAGSIPKLCKDSVLIMVDRYKAAMPIAENICASFGNFLRINSSASSTTPRDTT